MGIQITHRYDDIINLEYPLKSADTVKHPRMTVEDRAKIFAPFAALKGYEDAIAAKQKIVVPRVNLSEEVKEYLDRQLGRITHLLEEGTHPIIRVVFFEKDHTVQKKQEDEEEKGQYIQFTGMVAKLDTTSGWIQIVDRKLQLKDICKIESEELEEKA